MAYNQNPSYLPLSGGTMSGILTLSGNPVGSNDAANKAYVDALVAGLTFITATVCATTATLNATYANGAAGVGATLTNAGALAAFTVDSITPTINQRILVKNQTNAFQNGVYQISTLGSGAVAWVLTRTTDYDTTAQILPGNLVPVTSGTVNANTTWLQTNNIVAVGTSAVNFQQFSSTPIQTTQYASLVGGAANSIVSVGPSSISGQLYQSKGSSANPAFTTATYPSSSGGTGKVLYDNGTNFVESVPTFPAAASAVAGKIIISDGTNWVASTPTYPNASAGTGKILYDNGTNFVESVPTFPASASATARKIIVSDGTNWNASTETYAVPGTAGNLMQSDGTNWISATPIMQVKTGSLTNAQIKALSGGAVQLIGAPGSGQMIIVVSCIGKLVYGGSNIFTDAGGDGISLTYGSGTSNPMCTLLSTTQIVKNANELTLNYPTSTLNGSYSGLSDISVYANNVSGTQIAGNAANDNTVSYYIVYYIATI